MVWYDRNNKTTMVGERLEITRAWMSKYDERNLQAPQLQYNLDDSHFAILARS